MCAAACDRLERLSNELLLDIFEYLDGYDLCQAFYGLNNRISTLLQSAHLHILHSASKKSESVWNTLQSFIDPSQVRHLSTNYEIDIDKHFLPFCYKNNHSLRLQQIPIQYIKQICEYLPLDNQIKSLHIQDKWMSGSQSDTSLLDLILVNHAHQFHSIINLSLLPSTIKYDFVHSPTTVPQLRRLSINNYYHHIIFFQFLQDNTPNLRSLKLVGYFNRLNSSSYALKHIKELDIGQLNDLVVLQNVLSSFPSLRRLCINWQESRRNPFFNGSQWQQLIERYLPDLKQWTVTFDEGMDEDSVKTFYSGEFWASKKVKVKMLINKAQSRYRLVKSIYFGKEWRYNYSTI